MTLVEQLRARADDPDAVYSSTDAKRDCDAADKLEQLLALSQNNARSWDAIVRERDELRDEIEKLQADIRALNRELDSWEEKSRHG